MKFDLHIHSKYSYDSLMDPRRVIKVAQKRGLDGIAITDHNTIKGGVEALKVNKNEDFKVIVGAEIKTDHGDISGLFLNEEIKSRRYLDVIDEIKSQGGLSVLVHPYRGHISPERIANDVDIIEAFNARSKKSQNMEVYDFAKKFEKPIVAGSDAHSLFEIGRGITIANPEIKKSLTDGRTSIEGRESNYFLTHGLSIGMEWIKRLLNE